MQDKEQEMVPAKTIVRTKRHQLFWTGGPILLFVILSLPLFVVIHLWKMANGRFGVGEFLLPLSVFGINTIALLISMLCLQIFLLKSGRIPQFKWAILLLALGLLFLVASSQFLLAMPTDGPEGWTYLFSSLIYPFFVGFTSIWFLLHITGMLISEKEE